MEISLWQILPSAQPKVTIENYNYNMDTPIRQALLIFQRGPSWHILFLSHFFNNGSNNLTLFVIIAKAILRIENSTMKSIPINFYSSLYTQNTKVKNHNSRNQSKSNKIPSKMTVNEITNYKTG